MDMKLQRTRIDNCVCDEWYHNILKSCMSGTARQAVNQPCAMLLNVLFGSVPGCNTATQLCSAVEGAMWFMPKQ